MPVTSASDNFTKRCDAFPDTKYLYFWEISQKRLDQFTFKISVRLFDPSSGFEIDSEGVTVGAVNLTQNEILHMINDMKYSILMRQIMATTKYLTALNNQIENLQKEINKE